MAPTIKRNSVKAAKETTKIQLTEEQIAAEIATQEAQQAAQALTQVKRAKSDTETATETALDKHCEGFSGYTPAFTPEETEMIEPIAADAAAEDDDFSMQAPDSPPAADSEASEAGSPSKRGPGRPRGSKNHETNWRSLEGGLAAGIPISKDLVASEDPALCLKMARSRVEKITGRKSAKHASGAPTNLELHAHRVTLLRLLDAVYRISQDQLVSYQEEVATVFLPAVRDIRVNPLQKIADYFDANWTLSVDHKKVPNLVRAVQAVANFTQAKSVVEARKWIGVAYSKWSENRNCVYIQCRIVLECMAIFAHFLDTHILQRTQQPPTAYAHLFSAQVGDDGATRWVMRNPQELLDTPTVWYALSVA